MYECHIYTKYEIFMISGLPIGERENIKSAKEEKQKYRKELQDQIAKNLIKKKRSKIVTYKYYILVS